MAKQLIISDIHGNFTAYNEFMNKLMVSSYFNFDEILCLGDVVGYYPQVKELWQACGHLAKLANFRTGNHDIALARFLLNAPMDANDIAILCLAVQRSFLLKHAPEILSEMEEAFAPSDK